MIAPDRALGPAGSSSARPPPLSLRPSLGDELLKQSSLNRLVLIEPAEHVAAELHVPATPPQLDDTAPPLGNSRLDIRELNLRILLYVQLGKSARREDLAVSRAGFAVSVVQLPVHSRTGHNGRRSHGDCRYQILISLCDRQPVLHLGLKQLHCGARETDDTGDI